MKRLLCKILGHKTWWSMVCWNGQPSRWKQKCKRCGDIIADLPVEPYRDASLVCPSCDNHEIRWKAHNCMVCNNFSRFTQIKH